MRYLTVQLLEFTSTSKIELQFWIFLMILKNKLKLKGEEVMVKKRREI